MRRKVDRPVVLACDEAYQPAACVCLTSLFLNSPDVEFVTYLLTDSPNDKFGQAVARLNATFGRDIKIAYVEPQQVSQFVRSLGPIDIPAHISPAALLRLLAAEVLPLDSFLYLDCDIVVQESVAYLLTLDVGDNLVAAVPDGLAQPDGRKRVRCDRSETYFNTGVLAINTKAWRKAGGLARIREICLEYRGRLSAADQDIVNVLCRSAKVMLEPHWNTLLNDFLLGQDWSTLDVD